MKKRIEKIVQELNIEMNDNQKTFVNNLCEAPYIMYFIKLDGQMEYSLYQNKPNAFSTFELCKVFAKEQEDWQSFQMNFLDLDNDEEIYKKFIIAILNSLETQAISVVYKGNESK